MTITSEQKICIKLSSYYKIYIYKEKEFNYARLCNNKSLLNCKIYIKTLAKASCQYLKNCINSQQQNLLDTDFLQYFRMIYNGVTRIIQNRSSCTCIFASSNVVHLHMLYSTIDSGTGLSSVITGSSTPFLSFQTQPC